MRKTTTSVLGLLVTAVMLMSFGNVAGAVTPDIVVPYTTSEPTFDGNITAGEYAAAEEINFDVDALCGLDDGEVSIYVMHDGQMMYIAVDAAYDTTNNYTGFDVDEIYIYIDVDHDGEMDFLTDEDDFPYEDVGFNVEAEQYNWGYGSFIAGGITGFAKTALSSDKHAIFEMGYDIRFLPEPGEIFGMFIWGHANGCEGIPLASPKNPSILETAEDEFAGYAYPDDVMENNNAWVWDGDGGVWNNMTVDNFAHWTLQTPYISIVKVDKFPAFLTWFFIAILGIGALLMVTKDKELERKNYRNIVLVIMLLALVGLGVLYYYGLLAFS